MCNAVPNRAQQQLVVQQPSTAASLTAKMLGAEFDGESMPISSAQERGHHCGRGGCCKLAFDVHSPSRWLQNAHDADACEDENEAAAERAQRVCDEGGVT